MEPKEPESIDFYFQQYIDIEEMSRLLHKNHSEYGRKKLRVFRALCEAAFEHIDMGNDDEESADKKAKPASDDKSRAETADKKKETPASVEKSKESVDKKLPESDKKAAERTRYGHYQVLKWVAN